MSAFDKIQSYSARRGLHETSDVFDTTTPEGAFLARVHSEGYSMYSKVYSLNEAYRLDDVSYASLDYETMQKYDKSLTLSENEYNALTDIEKDKYTEEIVFSELHDALTTGGNQVVNAVAGSGKSLRNGTGVLTPSGYVPIESIKVGDLVLSDDGVAHTVIGIYPQATKLQGYECIFEDGTKIVCSGDHLWSDIDGTLRVEEMYKNKPCCGFILPKVMPIYIENCQFNMFYAMSVEERQEIIEDLNFNRKSSDGYILCDSMTEYDYKSGVFKSMGYAIIKDTENELSFVPKRHHHMIDIVPLTEEYEMTCIEIDSPSHLYLTENMIPTHNTSMLVFKIIHDIVTGEAMTLKSIPNGGQVPVVNKMWVCTFLKTGAEELEQALTSWQRKLGYRQTSNQISFSTMDAEFKRCLNAMGVATQIGSPDKLNSLLRKAIDSCGITRNGSSLNKEDYQIISGIVTYYRGRLDDKKYRHPSCKDYDLTPTVLDLVVKQFEGLRLAEGIMDFEEIMELLYKYLYVTPNPAVQDFVSSRYNYIYVDEFQDTSQMAYAILKFYARGNLWINKCEEEVKVISDGGTIPDGLYTAYETLGKLVVVGDTSQCLLPSAIVDTIDGYKDITEINIGERIKTCIGNGKTDYLPCSNVSARWYNGLVVHIETESEKLIEVTPEHRLFVSCQHDILSPELEFKVEESDDCFNRFCPNDEIDVVAFAEVNEHHHMVSLDGETYFVNSFNDADEVVANNRVMLVNEYFNLVDYKNTNTYAQTRGNYESEEMFLMDYASSYYENFARAIHASEIGVGSHIIVYDGKKGIIDDEVVYVGMFHYSGLVYDITMPETRNFIADDVVSHNCIYSFRGSDSTILAKNVIDDFHPTVNALSCNWRCPSNILNPVVPSIHENEDSASQKIIASRQGGEFFAYRFPSYKSMVAQLKQDIQKDMDDGLKVAILCRTNFDGMIPAFVLESDGKFDFSISGENMTMNSPLPRKIIGVTALFTERSTPAVKNALAFFCGRGSDWQLKQLMDTLKMNNMSIWQLPIDDIKYSCPNIVDFVTEIKSIIMPDGKNHDKEREIEALRGIYCLMITDVFGGDSAYCESARAYLETLIYIIDNHDFKSVYEFIEEVEFLNDKLCGRVKKAKAPIRIATVHEFKGKECDSVYIWNDSEGTFPSSKCDERDTEQLNEERRVHYIACTRAKKREHIYTLGSKVSRFVNEMDLVLKDPVPVGVTLRK